MTRSHERRPVWGGVVTFVVLAVAWYMLTTLTNTIGSGRFSSPAETWDALRQIAFAGYADARLAEHILHSVKLVLLGFAAAAIVGVPLGLAMGASRGFEAFLNPTFLLIRPIPPLAWIPLAIVWLGLGDGAKIMVIWFAAFVPSAINTFTGVRHVNPILIEAARVHGATDWRVAKEVVAPAALPMLFTGLRLSLQASWTTLVAAELVGAFLGLGRVLSIAYRDIYPAMITVAMVAIAIAGALMKQLLARIERIVIRWR